MLIFRLVVAILAGYLLGSVPFGALVGRLYKGVDIRQYGSGRTGATNVLRTLGPGAAACVAIGDLTKGAAAILLAHAIMQAGPLSWQHVAEALTGIAAIGGHNWSIFMRWTGGRGVLVAGGALLVLVWPAFLACAIAGLAVIALSRLVSLGSLVAVIVAAVAILGFIVVGDEPRPYAIFAVIGATVIILQHRDNIERLRAGKERRLGQRETVTRNPGAA